MYRYVDYITNFYKKRDYRADHVRIRQIARPAENIRKLTWNLSELVRRFGVDE